MLKILLINILKANALISEAYHLYSSFKAKLHKLFTTNAYTHPTHSVQEENTNIAHLAAINGTISRSKTTVGHICR